MDGFEVEKEGIAAIRFLVDNLGCNGGGSFKVDHGSDAAAVGNMHKAGPRLVGDVVRDWDKKSNTKHSPLIRDESWGGSVSV